jgi:hypothetical protein
VSDTNLSISLNDMKYLYIIGATRVGSDQRDDECIGTDMMCVVTGDEKKGDCVEEVVVG